MGGTEVTNNMKPPEKDTGYLIRIWGVLLLDWENINVAFRDIGFARRKVLSYKQVQHSLLGLAEEVREVRNAAPVGEQRSYLAVVVTVGDVGRSGAL